MFWRGLFFAAVAAVILGVVVALLIGFGHVNTRYTYPYGPSHCCLKGLGLALRQYAEENNGHFPAGRACPEASLSLLDHGGDSAEELCGKTKSAEVAKAILERGEPLGPDTCDWHYVEGLTLADDDRIAIIWDKVGLGHGAQRLPEGGHSIWRLGFSEEVIPEAKWPQFLEEQKRLLAARTEGARKGVPALAAKIRLPNGKIVDHYDAPYELEEVGGHSLYDRGSSLGASKLRWWRLSGNGTTTLKLSFNGWKSKPVAVDIWGGKATPNSVIFEMQAEKTP
jgi:hypothetical protein